VVATGCQLLERTVEIDLLAGAIDRAVDGSGGLIAIEAAAGVGKTALLDVAVERAEGAGMAAFRAVSTPLEESFSFGVVRQLLERPLLAADEEERGRLLAGAARLGAPALGIAEPAGPEADGDFGVLHGLYWLVANLSSERPLLLAVDDVQWADRGSLRFLAHLARRLGDLPVALALARRTGEPEAEPDLLAELAEGPAVTALAPRALSEAGSARLLAAEMGVPPSVDFARRLHLETAGNPFLLRELSRELDAADAESPADAEIAAPRSVARAVLPRLRRLGPEAVALADAVAILGDGCSTAEAAALAGLSAGDARQGAAALVRAGLLAPDELPRFAHPLVRSAIEGERTAGERALAHGRAARLLISRGAARERIVAQLLLAGAEEDPDAAALLHEAGRDALAGGAPGPAARMLGLAVECSPPAAPPGELLTDLGVALVLAERPGEATAALERARELADDPATLVDRTLKLWLALLITDRLEEGVGVLDATIAALGEEHREEALMLEGEYVTAALFDPTRLGEMWRRLDRFEGLAGDTPAERRLLAMLTAKSQYEVAHPPDALAAMARRALGEGRLITENPLDPTKWVWGVGALIVSDRVAESAAALELALATARSNGSVETLVMARNLSAFQALRLGRLADAEADATEGLERLREAQSTVPRDLIRMSLVRWVVAARTGAGRLEEAERLLVEEGLAGELPAASQHAKLRRERALLWLAQGRPEEALADAEALEEVQRRYAIDDVVEAPWRHIAILARIGVGDTETAATLADDHLTLVRRWGLPRDLGVALRLRALAENDAERREELLRQSLEALTGAPAPLEVAETQAALGRTMLRAGRRSASREPLALALDGATRCGAGLLAAMARDDLRVAGAKPRRSLISGVDSLTAAERRTAGLAATGLTNREIAQSLFLSVRTVENTLARVYRKLGISSRRELAASLADGCGTSGEPQFTAQPASTARSTPVT
jgi:DNA-binding CsgD family transcriptional regulator